MAEEDETHNPSSPFDSPTFNLHMSIRVDQAVGSMSISPCGRDVVLASRQGLHVIDLDSPYSPPRHLPHRTPWEVADVQWSPFAIRDYWVVSTSNQKALVWNLDIKFPTNAIEHVLHAHSRAITDINFSAHHPDVLATCAVDSFVHCWDLRTPVRPSMTFCDWFAGATQVKWNRQDPHIIASSHDKFLRIWDERKGAYPLRSIEAHDTKIYGVDWNRTRPSGIITCSLDKSIKFWDYGKHEDEPERVVRTPFPVWRARHTPFGWGMLAMPQRENSDLHLYDRRLTDGMETDAMVPAIHRFEGHQDQVKEFLWRFRGGVADNIDHREFQLVTWGTDRDLRLHQIDDQILERVGYKKGREVRQGLNITRKGAPYRTFRDENLVGLRHGSAKSARPGKDSRSYSGASKASSTAGAISAGMKKAPIPLSKGWGGAGYTTPATGMQARQSARKTISAIDWMKGVKIGKKEAAQRFGRHGGIHGMALDFMSSNGRLDDWETPESLGDEITQVAAKYSKVTFDHVDVQRRVATISMNGPWGVEAKPVYVKVDIKFPADYPESSAPSFELERTTSIPEDILDEVLQGLQCISQVYASRHGCCLEAVVSYLLGERTLNESSTWLFEAGADGGLDADALAGQITSDEEDNEIGQAVQVQDLESSGTGALGVAISNANVPLPKACGAVFTRDSRLICFFPPKPERFRASIGPLVAKDLERLSKAHRKFEGFGRLEADSPDSNRNRIFSLHEDDEGKSDSQDAFTSSSGSSSSSEDLMDAKLSGFPRWRGARAHDRRFPRALSTDNSQLSVGQGSSSLRTMPSKPKNIISFHRLDELIPAKRVLAREYLILGDGPSVCEHNAKVAQQHGFQDLADIWHLAKLILHNQVPLEMLHWPSIDEPILVLAKQAASPLYRTDSGLDLAYDETKSASSARLTGRVRWGHHPFGGASLIDSIFRHFERMADVQMLAMLSCVFAEPAVESTSSRTTTELSLRDKAMFMKIPTFAMDYFASADMAWRHHHRDVPPLPPTPGISHTPFETHSFAGSSDGPSGQPPNTPFLNGNTPPSSYKNERALLDKIEPQTQSLAGSPERQHGRRSNASLTSALSVGFYRGLSHSASTGKKKLGLVRSTSGSLTPGGITWGVNTFIAPSLNELPANSSATYSESDADEDELQMSGEPKARVVMKNQHMFDCEGHSKSPLLKPQSSVRHRGYRATYANLLGVWGLELQRLELLKFNGLQNLGSSELSTDQPFTSSLATKGSGVTESPAWKGLEIGRFCSKCGNQLQRKAAANQPRRGDQSQCTSCSRQQRRMACSICYEMITGMYAPCLGCGHVAHSSCHEAWFRQPERECPTGCGCQCTTVALRPPMIVAEPTGARRSSG